MINARIIHPGTRDNVYLEVAMWLCAVDLRCRGVWYLLEGSEEGELSSMTHSFQGRGDMAREELVYLSPRELPAGLSCSSSFNDYMW